MKFLLVISLLSSFLLSCRNNENLPFKQPGLSGSGGGGSADRPPEGVPPGVVDPSLPINTPPSQISTKYLAQDVAKAKQRVGPMPIDILFSVENSGSMDPFIEETKRNIHILIDNLTREAVDYRIGLIKGNNIRSDCPNPDDCYYNDLFGPNPVIQSTDPNPVKKMEENLETLQASYDGAQEKPISMLVSASQRFLDENRFFRANAGKVFFILSDVSEGAGDLYFPAASDFSYFFSSLGGDNSWLMIAIGSPPSNPCHNTESHSQPLISEVVDASGGVMGRICDGDYSGIMLDSLRKIFEMLREFSLLHRMPKDAVPIADSIRVDVDGTAIPKDPEHGFEWNQDKRVLKFPGQYIPPGSSIIEVHYEFEL